MQSIPKPVRHLLWVLGAWGVLVYLVLPQIAGARQALDLLGHVNLADLCAGVALELAALAAYAQLTRVVLPPSSRPSLWRVLRINYSTLAVSHLVPGGAAAGGSLGYRLLTASGVAAPDAGFALATQGIGSAVVLNVLLWLGLLVSIPARGFQPVYATAAVVGALLLGTFGVVVLALSRGEARAAAAARWVAGRVPFLDEGRVDRLVHRLARRLEELASDRPLLLRGIGWAAANWLLDAASLWVFLAAFGYPIGIDGLVVSFALANVLAAIPLTPGGLGVVEAVLTTSLVGFGAPRGIAILGVVSYRLVNFWLPIPLGALSYLSLRASAVRRRESLERVATQSIRDADRTAAWAERVGLKPRDKRPG